MKGIFRFISLSLIIYSIGCLMEQNLFYAHWDIQVKEFFWILTLYNLVLHIVVIFLKYEHENY